MKSQLGSLRFLMRFCHCEVALDCFSRQFSYSYVKLIYDPSISTCYSSNISQASSEHIHSQTFLLRGNVFTPYSCMKLGLYSNFISLIMYRLEEKVKGMFLRHCPSRDLKVILRLLLKKKNNILFFRSTKNFTES